MDACGPELVPGYFAGDDDTTRPHQDSSGTWCVNLDNFDIELVIFILPPPDSRSKSTGKLGFGISLCPHSFLHTKSFASGQIPPDVTAPYLGSEILSQEGVVRLRPTTAHLLLQMAKLQPYDVVLDPCAGIGTIPIEAEQYMNQKQCVAIGGDLILNNPKYTNIASIMENFNNNKNDQKRSMLVAWDAAHLPVRTNSVDVAVSDLPFGQQCLSGNTLHHLLPLIFLECARVLTPNTGRMVMLCGGSPMAIISSIEQLSGKYWRKPISRVSPVSIGGILAWIVVVVRNGQSFDDRRADDSLEKLALVRKLAQKRDRISRHRKSESGEQQTCKRRR